MYLILVSGTALLFQQSRFFMEVVMRIIDFHTHIYPPKIASKAVSSVGDFYNLKMHGRGTAGDLIEQGKECGITSYVILPVAVTPHHVEHINNFAAEEVMQHPEFYGFGTTHAEYENKIGEAERVVSLGLKGIKIHPDTQGFNIDDERMFEFYDFLQQTDMPIIMHCGDYRYTYSHPKRLKNVLGMFPKLTVIAAHFGGWSVYDLAYEYLKDEKCYLDTSSSFKMLGNERSKELIKMYGAERIVFGSDFPMRNSFKELETFLSFGLSDSENELILHKNAEKILKIKEV